METKTNLRLILEKLEDDIHKSWLKDLDKTIEIKELTRILENMIESESLEIFFSLNSNDLDYFLKKFTKEILSNILRQNFIYGDEGDDVASALLFSYLKLFLKFNDKPQYSVMFDYLREIFDCNKNYYNYKNNYPSSMQVINPKKIISAEKFNDSLPSKKNINKEYSIGENIDLLIENKKGHNLGDHRVWVRGVVDKIENDSYFVNIAEEGVYVRVGLNSFDLAPGGTMTQDHEWRTTLKKWDVIDGYDRGKWFPATILQVVEEIINGLPKVSYKVGFRLYPDTFLDYQLYKKYWNDRGVITDSNGKKIIGDPEGMDEWISYFSKRIQKFNTFIMGDSVIYNTKSLSHEYDTYFIDQFIPFEHEGNKNYIIARGSNFSYYYATLIKHFATDGGFEKLIKILTENKPYPELVHFIFFIFYSCFSYLHKDYVKIINEDISRCAISYIENLNNNELRNIKKDTLQLITNVLKCYLSISSSNEEVSKKIENFYITSSIKMLKTNFLDKRIQAIKTLVDIIKASKSDKNKSEAILKLIAVNGVFYEIFGPNTHIQLINKSKEFLQIMAEEDKLSDGELEIIWNATKKGDLEGKLTILKTLKEISKSLNSKHIRKLLENIYASNENNGDLICEEIELIYDLSILLSIERGMENNEISIENKNQNEEIKKCINFFSKYLINSKSDQSSYIDALITKIYEICKNFKNFRIDIFKMCIDFLNTSEINNSIIAIKILSKFLEETPDYDISFYEYLDNDLKFIFEDNKLVKTFCDNFRKYKLAISNNFSNFEIITHTQNIKLRLKFSLILNNISLLSFDCIEFLYEMLIEDPVCETDSHLFYSCLKNILEKNHDKKLEEKIFKIFENKICKDTKSCQTLSYAAFQSFLSIFLNINSRVGNLKYYQSAASKDKLNFEIYIIQENLIGFQILWKIVFESFSSEIMNKGIEILHTLYTGTCIKENSDSNGRIAINTDNWALVNENKEKNVVKLYYSEILLQKLLNLVKSVLNEIKDKYDSFNNIEESRNIILKCLFFLKLIIEESEKKGTARIKSHSGLLKTKIINLKIDSHIARTKDFEIKIYGNTTIWELKELISRKAEIGIDFINIMLKKNNSENNKNNESDDNDIFNNKDSSDYKDISPSENGLTVTEMNLSDKDEIRLMMNNTNNYIPNIDLVKNGVVVPELIKIYNCWYNTFSTNGKMLKEDLAKFTKTVTSSREDIDITDQRIVNLFAMYDKENKGWIERNFFVSFYNECALRHDRRRAVWENLHAMGYRNDLKKYEDSLEVFNNDKTVLPRYQLAHNEEWFNVLFSLQDLHESIAKEAFKFLCTIMTNPKIYKEILEWEKDKNKKLFNNENIYKLIYTFQIIESFIEDVQIESEGVEAFSIEESIMNLDLNNNINSTQGEIINNKKIWIQRFVEQGGLEELVKILIIYLKENKTDLMTNILIGLLVKIIKVFFNSSLSKYEINNSGFKNNYELSDLFQGEIGSKILATFNNYSLCLWDNLIRFILNLIEIKENSADDLIIIKNAFELLIGIITFTNTTNSNLEFENRNEIFYSKKEEMKKIYLFGILNKNCNIKEQFNNILSVFCKIWNELKYYNFIIFFFLLNFDIVTGKIVSMEKDLIIKNKINLTLEFYEFFAILFEIYLNNKEQFELKIKEINENENNFDPNLFIHGLAQEIFFDLIGNKSNLKIMDNQKINQNLSNDQFIGNLKFLTKVVENCSEFKKEINTNFNLIRLLLTKVLFKQNSKEQNDKIAKFEFINPDKIEENINNRSANLRCREASYNFILAMLRDSIENFESFFSINILQGNMESEKSPSGDSSAGLNDASTPSKEGIRNYYRSMYCKKEGHVGLRNLGCICYMNSMMQQFFMVPSFRYSILQSKDNIITSMDKSNLLNIDDNVLHQVQRMFTYLDFSEKEDYNPQGFCYSFKDFDGNPTNTSIQQDSQEFLNRFFDKLENSLKQTPFKYTLQSIFGGTTCSQLICQEGCGSVRNRYEDFNNLSLEVANMKNLNESLEKFISPERIDEYNCEACQKKVTITKRNSIAQLPNVLIIHLQRIYYNYENDRNEKINTKLQFPKNLNLKNYTSEELMRKKNCANDNTVNSESENVEIYFKTDDYYEYNLVGVNVHIGSADAGHYFSYINTVRKGEENKPEFDENNPSHMASWLKFNDSHISKFNVNKLEEECFGGSTENNSENDLMGGWSRLNSNQSAYMLIYERKEKSPIKIIVEEPLDKTDLVSFKEEENLKIKKIYDINRINYKNENITLTGNSKENSFGSDFKKLCFYDNSKNEYFILKDFFSFERLLPRDYYIEVSTDNLQFQKSQNILDEQFTNFFEKVIALLGDSILNINNCNNSGADVEKEMSNSSGKICQILLNFIFTILNNKEKQKLLGPAIRKLSQIIDNNKNLLEITLDYILNNFNLVKDALFNDEEFIVEVNSKLIFNLIKSGFNNNKQEFRILIENKIQNTKNEENKCTEFFILSPITNQTSNSLLLSISEKTLNLLEYIIELFPTISKVNKIYPLYENLKNLILLGEEMVLFFNYKESISRFITYLIGKESPCYGNYFSKLDNKIFNTFSSPTHPENLITLICQLFKKITIEKDQKNNLLQISENDKKCIKTPHFLKFCFSDNPELFTELLINFSSNIEEFTLQICEDITRYIDDIGYQNENDLIKLVHAILPVLNINDSHQLLRMESIMGFPVVIIEEPNLRSKWPLFGYNKLNDDKSKWIEYRSAYNIRGCCSILKKLSNFKGKEKVFIEVFLEIMSSCVVNKALLKYIRNIPAEEPQYEDFLSWGISCIHLYTKRYELNNYFEKLKIIVEKINPYVNEILNDYTILKGFKSFNNKYLHYEIKREEIQVLMTGDNLFVIKFEYFTNTIPFSKDTNFKKSASCYGSGNDSLNIGYSNSIIKSDRTIDDSQNIKSDDFTIVYDMNDRLSNEREFLKRLLPALSDNKKIVIQNKYFIENVSSTMIRYVIFNTSNLDGTVYMKFKRPDGSEDKNINEFIPNSIASNINSFFFKNILTVSKIDTSQDWSGINNLEYKVQVNWQEKSSIQSSAGQFSAGINYSAICKI